MTLAITVKQTAISVIGGGEVTAGQRRRAVMLSPPIARNLVRVWSYPQIAS